MGHVSILLDKMRLDEMGLDEMGLDEMGINPGTGCAVVFTCPCDRSKIHGDRTSVAYSTSKEQELKLV